MDWTKNTDYRGIIDIDPAGQTYYGSDLFNGMNRIRPKYQIWIQKLKFRLKFNVKEYIDKIYVFDWGT